MLHLCLTILALTTLALAAGLGDLDVSLEEGCELVGEGAGVAPGFPPLSPFLLSLGLSLDLPEPPSFWFLDLPSPFCRTTLLLFFGCMESQWLFDLHMELLSTQPHLPTSAMTLRHTAATSPQNTNHQWGWVQISVGVTEVKDKAAAEVKQAPAVGTPERHYRPLEHAREKRRLRSSVRCVLCNYEFTDLEWSQAGWAVEKMVICKTCIDLMSAGSKHRAKIPHPTD